MKASQDIQLTSAAGYAKLREKSITEESDVIQVNKGSFQSKNQPKDQKPWWWQFAGLSVLIGSMLGGSSIGVLTNFVPIQSPFAKNAWRSGLLCMTFFPLALLEYKHRRSQLNYRELINITQYLWLILTLFCQVMWAMGLIYASLNIIQSQAYVFNNIHGLFLVLIGVLQGITPHRAEIQGVVLSLLGCICMVLDPQAKRASNQSASITPALLDAFSAIFGAFYFLLSARHVKRIPICLLVFLMSAHTFLINSAIAKIHDSQIEFLSLDPTIGLFGFLNPSQPMMPLILYWILGSVLGSAGYTISLLFYSPVVTCNAYLIEPLIAQTFGYIVGLDGLPGILTAVGTVFAIYGIMNIDQGAKARQTIDETRLEPLSPAQAGLHDLTLSRGGISSANLSFVGAKSFEDLNISHLSGR